MIMNKYVLYRGCEFKFPHLILFNFISIFKHNDN